MSNNKSNKPWNVSKATRNAVVATAEHVERLKEKTNELAHRAGEKWEESKPQQQKAKDELKKSAKRLVDFGKDVRSGLKEGFAEVQKRNKKK